MKTQIQMTTDICRRKTSLLNFRKFLSTDLLCTSIPVNILLFKADVVLVFLLLTLNRFHNLLTWACICLLVYDKNTTISNLRSSVRNTLPCLKTKNLVNKFSKNQSKTGFLTPPNYLSKVDVKETPQFYRYLVSNMDDAIITFTLVMRVLKLTKGS